MWFFLYISFDGKEEEEEEVEEDGDDEDDDAEEMKCCVLTNSEMERENSPCRIPSRETRRRRRARRRHLFYPFSSIRCMFLI